MRWAVITVQDNRARYLGMVWAENSELAETLASDCFGGQGCKFIRKLQVLRHKERTGESAVIIDDVMIGTIRNGRTLGWSIHRVDGKRVGQSGWWSDSIEILIEDFFNECLRKAGSGP